MDILGEKNSKPPWNSTRIVPLTWKMPILAVAPSCVCYRQAEFTRVRLVKWFCLISRDTFYPRMPETDWTVVSLFRRISRKLIVLSWLMSRNKTMRKAPGFGIFPRLSCNWISPLDDSRRLFYYRTKVMKRRRYSTVFKLLHARGQFCHTYSNCTGARPRTFHTR